MKQKKIINIILITVVLSLWGTAGLRVVKNLVPVGNISNPEPKDTPQLLTVKRDTFELKALSRDPFSGSSSSRPTIHYATKQSLRIRAVTPSRKNVTPKSQIQQPWPKIQYLGYIKTTTHTELALIRINEKLFKMHRGDTNNGVTINNITKDSIAIEINKEIKIFKK